MAYTPNSKNTVAVLNTTTNTVIDTISIDMPDKHSISSLAISPDNSRLYVAYGVDLFRIDEGNVAIIDLNNNRLINTIPLDHEPQFITIHPDDSKLYVTYLFGNISVIDIQNQKEITTLSTHTTMQRVIISQNGSRIYAPHNGVIRIFDTIDYEHLSSIGVWENRITWHLGSMVTNLDSSRLYLTSLNGDYISVINTTNNTLIDTMIIEDIEDGSGRTTGFVNIAIHPDSSKVYIADAESYKIYVFDTATNTISNSISLKRRVSSIAVHPNGSRIYATHYRSEGTSIIDTDTQNVVETLPEFGDQRAIVFRPLPSSKPPIANDIIKPTPPHISDGVTLKKDLQMNIPQLVYQTDSGKLQFWGRLDFVPTNDGSLIWEVKEYGEYTGNTAINATDVILTQKLRLIIPKLTYQGSSFSGSFTYVPTQDGKIRFKLNGYTTLKDVLIETNLSRGEEVTDASGKIKIKSIDNSGNVNVQIIEGIDEEGDGVYNFMIDGGTVEITLPDPNIISKTRRAIRDSANENYSIGDIIYWPWIEKEKIIRRYFYTTGLAENNRVPESRHGNAKGNFIWRYERLMRHYFKMTTKDASQIYGSCHPDFESCYNNKNPVLFVHGYTLGGKLGGGEDSWKNFPILLEELGYITFEFKWRTAARFEDVANDLGLAVNLIHQRTGKKVHIIAHSFGGLLVRTWLQGLASNDSTPTPNDIVGSLTTLGTPHSGIADTNKCMGIALPAGQDSLSFEGCDQISCDQAGEPIISTSFSKQERRDFELGKPGDIISKLADVTTNTLPNIDILVQIGLTTPRGYNSKVDEGDGLISYEGQRFLPQYTVTGVCNENSGSVSEKIPESLKNHEFISNAYLTEILLGFDADITPDSNNFNTNFGGYYHTQPISVPILHPSPASRESEVFIKCNSVTNCEHHGFNNTVQWLQDHTSGKSINFTVIVKDYNDTERFLGDAVITLFNDDGTKVTLGRTQIDKEPYGGLEFKVPFEVGKKIEVSVKVPGYKTLSKLLTTISNSVNETVGKENVFDVLVYPTELPTVTGVEVTIENANIQLSWNPVMDADHYNVYICNGSCPNGEGEYIPMSPHPTSTSFSDWRGSDVTKYYYVTAVQTDFKGDRVDESKPSEVIVAVVLPTSKPIEPQEQLTLPLTSNTSTIVAGDKHTCTITNSGGVKCWGNIGTINSFTPRDVITSSNTIAISSGDDYFCALADNGTLNCLDEWKNISLDKYEISTVAAGANYTCLVTKKNEVKCWGINSDGNLGDGSTTGRLKPVEVKNLADAVNISVTSTGMNRHTCAVTSNGEVKCWGNNAWGQVKVIASHSPFREISTPVTVDGLNAKISTIAVGNGRTCALTNNGKVKCWGRFNGTEVDTITDIDTLNNSVNGIALGSYHTCVLTDVGGVKCWGSNNQFGQLGDGTTIDKDYTTPVDVDGLSSGVIAIALGANHTCALINTGKIKCWGRNDSGQLGNGTDIDSAIPIDVKLFD